MAEERPNALSGEEEKFGGAEVSQAGWAPNATLLETAQFCWSMSLLVWPPQGSQTWGAIKTNRVLCPISHLQPLRHLSYLLSLLVGKTSFSVRNSKEFTACHICMHSSGVAIMDTWSVGQHQWSPLLPPLSNRTLSQPPLRLLMSTVSSLISKAFWNRVFTQLNIRVGFKLHWLMVRPKDPVPPDACSGIV